MKLPVYVADIKDDCLLRNDFLSVMNFEGTFASFLDISSQRKKKDFFYSRIMREVNKVPQFLKELFERKTPDLNEEPKKRFANFLTEFQDVFSEKIIAG